MTWKMEMKFMDFFYCDKYQLKILEFLLNFVDCLNCDFK